ncbi:MAG: hypothetical protein GYA42_00150 [Syntrophomonadaceae bacterium]|nr:hypothetical protein [Syntrophomonadaceae bacterium]
MSLEHYANAARGCTGSRLSNEEVLLGVLQIDPDIRFKACSELDQIMEAFFVPFPIAFHLIRYRFDTISAKYQIDPAILYWTYLRWTEENKGVPSQLI